MDINDIYVGVSPRIEDIEAILAISSSRQQIKYNNKRTLCFFDTLGISALCDSDSGLLYWLSIMFEYPRWRQAKDEDAEHEFSGCVIIGERTLTKPVSLAQAEEVRHVKPGALGFDFVPHGKSIAEMTIDFLIEE